MSTLLNAHDLIKAFGTLGIIAVVFAESGLLIGFFLPGDSLLFTAGLFASQGRFGLSLPVLIVGCCLAAVAGDQVGYQFGARVGPALFRRPDSRLFKQEYVTRAQSYFDRYGPRTIILARFVPIVRTFAPIVAGIGTMKWRTFISYNVVGGVAWASGVLIAGDILGKTVPSIDKYLLPAVLVIVALSLIPVLLEVLRARREAQH